MSDGVHAVIVEQNSSEDSWTDAEEEPKVIFFSKGFSKKVFFVRFFFETIQVTIFLR